MEAPAAALVEAQAALAVELAEALRVARLEEREVAAPQVDPPARAEQPVVVVVWEHLQAPLRASAAIGVERRSMGLRDGAERRP